MITAIRTGRYQWLIREWRVNDVAGFNAEQERSMGELDPAATLLQLSLVGITSMTGRDAILRRTEHDLRHRRRHLDLRADDLVATLSDGDLASLSVERALNVAPATAHSKVTAGEGGAALAKHLNTRSSNIRGRPARVQSEERALSREIRSCLDFRYRIAL